MDQASEYCMILCSNDVHQASICVSDPNPWDSFPGCCGISGSLALQEMRSLSGGQKSRVVLAELMTRRPHLLILDEVSRICFETFAW